MRSLKLSILIFIISFCVICYADSGNAMIIEKELPASIQYKGFLVENGVPVYGDYDFEFVLYDTPNDVNLAALPLFIEDVNVFDGHFNVELDFGKDAFDGNPRWLEIWKRLASSKKPFIITGQREKISPVPYALFAYDSNNTSSSGSENISRNSLNAADDNPTDAVYVDNEGNVGIGTTNPFVKLDVEGQVQMNGFIMPVGASDGYVLTSNSLGIGTWQSMTSTSSGLTGNGTTNYLSKFTSSNTLGISSIFDSSGNIGIGTSNPSTKLEVQGGVIKATGGLIIETRTSDPSNPVTGQIWLRTDL